MADSRLPMPSEIIEIMGSNYAKAEYTYSERDPTVITGIRLLDSTREGSTLKIPNGITAINAGLPVDDILKSRLKSIIFPNSLTSIGYGAFYGCNALTELVIPDSVTDVYDETFRGCNALTSLELGNSVTNIGNSAFYGCNALTELVIPDSVTSIYNRAFSGCSALTSLTLGDSVTSIGSNAFYGCNALTSLTLGDSVTSIGSNAFYGCNHLSDIYYSGTEEEWNAIAGISGCGFKGTETIHYNSTGPEE